MARVIWNGTDAPDAVRCSACKGESPPGMRFCGYCGQPLESAPAAEHRQVTVMFCDVVGSTALAERLGPERFHALLGDYQRVASSAVERYGGYVAQYLGDGILAYFGFPQAHEDDAHRALRAGLEILAGLGELDTRARAEHGVRLQLRIGVHTGPVVTGAVGFGAQREQLALGAAPNVAARLQALAGPDRLVTSDATRRIVSGYFDLHPLGSRSLDGVAEPMRVFVVKGQRDVEDRLEAAGEDLSPLIGRSHELVFLRRCFDRAADGAPQVVMLSGEAGLGKSRLLEAFRESYAERAGLWLVGRCSPYHRSTAFHPLLRALRKVLLGGEEGSLSAEAGWRRLMARLESLGMEVRRAPFLASLLAVPIPEAIQQPEKPQQQRRETLETLRILGRQVAFENPPMVLVLEDLHWADPSTLALLEHLVKEPPTAPLLLVFSFRSTFRAAWTEALDGYRLELERFDVEEVGALVEAVAGRAVPREILDQIVEKTDGVPLFVEELTKMVLESGMLRESDGRLELVEPELKLAIPTTLRGWLTARLDRLGAAREAAQIASVVGRVASHSMLAAICPFGEERLEQNLEQLVAAGLLFRRRGGTETYYVFKHALIQDLAYQSLLQSTRGAYHREIAKVLEDLFPERIENQPELLAHHQAEGGMVEPAIVSLERAARQAAERLAQAEALRHFEQALGLLATLPDDAHRQRRELELRTMAGPLVVAQKGYAANEVEQTYRRAGELSMALGDLDHLFWSRRGLWAYHLIRAELSKALELGRQMMDLSMAQGGAVERFEAHLAVALPRFFDGEIAQAFDDLERGLAHEASETSGDSSVTQITGLDTAAIAEAMSGVILWHLGASEHAARRCDEALSVARQVGQPFTLADVLSSVVWVRQLNGDLEGLESSATELLTVSREHGFTLHAQALVQLGWVEIARGAYERGLVVLRQGLEEYRANGARVFQPYIFSLLADGLRRAGAAEEALAALEEARTIPAGEGVFYWTPEILRLRGEITGNEEDLLRSLRLARRFGSPSLVLRGALSLARQRRQERRESAARKLVNDALGQFEEDRGSADLEAAHAFLGSSAASTPR